MRILAKHSRVLSAALLAVLLTVVAVLLNPAAATAMPQKPTSGVKAAVDQCQINTWHFQPWPPPTVRRGSIDRTTPSAVMLAQCYLNQALNPAVHGTLVVDGDFGGRTERAVITFQSDWCGDAPPVDGVVGSITWAGLRSWALSDVYAC